MGVATRIAAAAAAGLCLLGGTAAAMSGLLQWSDLYGRPRPVGRVREAYGPDPNQTGDWWTPKGPGPHPLVVVVHGGCWQASVAGLDIMDWASADLRDRGYLVYNLEYRRLGQAGGGYPGTYQDVASGIEHAVKAAPARGGDPAQLVVLGHSAGGHLALWAGLRGAIPPGSPLYQAKPALPRLVLALGAITDLEHDLDTACGADTVRQMRGPTPEADTSPYQMGRRVARTVLVTGAQDTTVPAALARRYADRSGAELRIPPGGHVEEIAPESQAWAEAVAALEHAAPPPAPPPPRPSRARCSAGRRAGRRPRPGRSRSERPSGSAALGLRTDKGSPRSPTARRPRPGAS